MPGELQEIAAELREEEELRANTEHLACLREKWRQQAETTADDRPGDNS
jgi:hypothetical protein